MSNLPPLQRPLTGKLAALLTVVVCFAVPFAQADAATFKVTKRSGAGESVTFKVKTKPFASCAFFAARGTTTRVDIGAYVASRRGRIVVSATVGGTGRPRLVGTCSTSRSSKASTPQSFETTAPNQSADAGPAFAASPAVDGAGASLADSEGALAWAIAQKGRTDYNWWCLKFVANAYGANAAGYEDPKQMASRFGVTGGSPTQAPRGALMIFAASADNDYHGHVGISLGDGRMVDAQRTVDIRSVAGNNYWQSRYVGWMPPAPAWPGRPSSSAPPYTPPAPTPVAPTPAPSSPPPTGTPAPAAPVTPAAPPTFRYSVNYTCANGACGLRKRSAPNTSSAVVGVLADGTPIDIVCQVQGEPVTGRAGTTVVWDRLADGSYISDYYTTTPGYLTWSSNIPRC